MKPAAIIKAVIIGVTACGVLVVSQGARSGEMSMDISGSWRLNKKLSDDPRTVMEKHLEKMREQMGDRGGMHGGYGSGRDGMGGPPRGGRVGMARDQQQRMEEMGQAAGMVRITQDEGVVTMIDGLGNATTFQTDGQERDVKTPRGVEKAYASWVDLALVVHTTTRDKRQFTRTYRINDDGRLEVVTRINPRRTAEPIEMVAVYDLVPDEN